MTKEEIIESIQEAPEDSLCIETHIRRFDEVNRLIMDINTDNRGTIVRRFNYNGNECKETVEYIHDSLNLVRR